MSRKRGHASTSGATPITVVDTLLQTPTGMPVATLVNVLGTTDYLFTVTHYDTFGRVVKVINQSYVGGSPAADKYDTEESKYSFQSLPVSTVRKHYVSGLQLTINNWSRYDHMNRPLASQQQFITSTVMGKVNTLSEIEYNEIGQSKTKHLGSTGKGPLPALNSFLQHIDLRYNERGWLSTINNPGNLTDPVYSGFDLFAEGLDYDKNNNGYTGISQISYNGNITSLSWQTKTPASLTPPFTQEQKGYIFSYDALNQMTNSVSQATTSGVGIYNEAVTYDELGNITTLIRKNSAVGPPLNSLTYNYTAGGVRSNRLLSVADAGSESQTSTYTYDTNGSLITDSKKTITTPIVYNELNLPSLVTINTGTKTLTYKYDAAGKKLERITKTGANVAEDRVYDDGIEYTGTTATTIDFVHTAEGRAIPSAGAYNYQYQVTDHLGNIRALFADANNNGILTADEIIQFSDYYPFGREINYNLSLPLTPANNYKYNGKEFQNDLSEYDYGARFYDAVIARWNVVDPMAEKGRRWAPYDYGQNNSIRNIDPDGMESLHFEGEDAKAFVKAYSNAEKKDGLDGKNEKSPECCSFPNATDIAVFIIRTKIALDKALNVAAHAKPFVKKVQGKDAFGVKFSKEVAKLASVEGGIVFNTKRGMGATGAITFGSDKVASVTAETKIYQDSKWNDVKSETDVKYKIAGPPIPNADSEEYHLGIFTVNPTEIGRQLKDIKTAGLNAIKSWLNFSVVEKNGNGD